MRLADRVLRLRGRFGLILTISALAVAALGLAGCRAVEDNLTGVQVDPDLAAWGQPDKCVRDCIKDWSKGVRTELRIHIKNKKDCWKNAGDGADVVAVLERGDEVALLELSDEVALLELSDEQLREELSRGAPGVTGGDIPPDVRDCLEDEARRLEAALRQLNADFESCLEDCNYESGGSGK